MSKYAHKLVAQVAREMAGAVYDEAAVNNEWYALNPSRKRFVRNVAPDLVMEARKVLAEMLGRNDTNEREKAEIYEALMMDSALPRGANTTMH